MKKCVYCGNEITEESKEHIIQNALGGLYESTDICCKECNNNACSKIDEKFTSIFNAIISKIPNMKKTNNKNSSPKCTGKALCEGKVYDVIIKNGKVVACPTLSKIEKCDISKKEFTIISYDFPIDNTNFKNGLGKIALNFALANGVDFEDICSGIEVKKDKNNHVEDIKFKFKVFPFVPLNHVDLYLELYTYMELYHNIILFSQGKYLWCYIDLFNTFQYYVLLSDKWEKNDIYKEYLQLIQRLNREIPEIYIRKPKDVLIYSDFYKIEPTLDVKKLKKRIEEAIRLASNKVSMEEKISEKLSGFLQYVIKECGNNRERMAEMLSHLFLYFDKDDHLITKRFRTITLINFNNHKIASYPLLIMHYLKLKYIDPKLYTFSKFDRLNQLLLSLKDIDD